MNKNCPPYELQVQRFKIKIMSQRLLQSPESFTPHDDFVGMILKL